MEAQGRLLRCGSWSRPNLRDSDILRTVSVDAQEGFMAAVEEERSESAEAIAETVATLCTTQRGAAWTDSRKQKQHVVQIDVQCTPGTAFEDIIRQLENPSLPTFKLIDLPVDANGDLYHMPSPTVEAGWPRARAPLREHLARLPFPQLDEKASQVPVQAAALAAASSLLLAGLQQEGGTRRRWVDLSREGQAAATDGSCLDSSSLDRDGSLASDERPSKRTRTGGSRSEQYADSGTDTGGSGAAHRGKRLVCLRCGTHQTPQWRMGPDGPRTLCNACGVKFKKEVKEQEMMVRSQRANKHAAY